MKNLLFNLAFACFISACFSSERQGYPGIRFRVTSKGLQYADDAGIKVLFKRLREENLKDISHSSKNLEYALSNIKNNRATISSSSFTTAPREGLTLRANGISLDFSGNLRFKKKIGWFQIKDSVRFSFKARGINFRLTVRIGVDSDGRPTVSARVRDCSSSVDSVHVKFSGGYSWLYNLFSSQIDTKVKDELNKLMCKKAREAINNEGAKFMATFPVLQNVSSIAQIDYSVVKRPKFTSRFMDLPLKGEFKAVGNPDSRSPFVPAPLPPLDEVDRMIYIWLTDYLFNTASFVYHEQGALRTIIRPSNVPNNKSLSLNTRTFKTFLYQLYNKYPNRPVFVKAYTTKPPVFASSRNGTNVTVNGNAEIHVIAKNGAPIYALTIGLRAVLSGALGVNHGNLTFHAKSFDIQVHLVKSAIGDIRYNIVILQMFLDQFIKSAHFVDQLNEYGGRGFPLPLPPHLSWEDTSLTTGEGFILVKTNLRHESRR